MTSIQIVPLTLFSDLLPGALTISLAAKPASPHCKLCLV